MAKRMIVTVTVSDDIEDATLADLVGSLFTDEGEPTPDPTAWEWMNFWQDVEEGVVTPKHDGTVTYHETDLDLSTPKETKA